MQEDKPIYTSKLAYVLQFKHGEASQIPQSTEYYIYREYYKLNFSCHILMTEKCGFYVIYMQDFIDDSCVVEDRIKWKIYKKLDNDQ